PVRTQFGYHVIKVTDRRPAQGQVAVSHIMLRLGRDRDSTKVRERAFNLYDQLMAGASWDELCAEYSEDPGSKSKGGALPPFGVGAMASVPEFERWRSPCGRAIYPIRSKQGTVGTYFGSTERYRCPPSKR